MSAPQVSGPFLPPNFAETARTPAPLAFEPVATRVDPAPSDSLRHRRNCRAVEGRGGETIHAAKSWRQKRRVVARIEATRLGPDIRYVVTNITTGPPEWLNADLYCAHEQAENLIKLHKT